MSDHIPYEIQVEIIKKLPIKSLIQFRSVSKPWKSVIDSADFIADYTVNSHAQPQHLLITYISLSFEETYLSIVDDDTFPQNKFSLTVPPSVGLLWNSHVVGSSHGVVCLFGYYRDQGDVGYRSGSATAVLWNPSIRKSVAIIVPDDADRTGFGFGVCPATCDPKIVKISDTKMRSVTCSSRWQFDVFSLSSGVWRSSFGNLSDKLVEFRWPCSHVTLDGIIYWIIAGNIIDGVFHLLISFDLSSEEFGEIDLPDELAFYDPLELHLLKRCESLALLRNCMMLEDIYEVWVMENGDSKSFTKLFTVNLLRIPMILSRPLEFRRNGELMLIITDGLEVSEALNVYEPISESINDLGIEGRCDSLVVSSYTESLILLGLPDILSDDEDDEEMSD